jgi:hypothetical protein
MFFRKLNSTQSFEFVLVAARLWDTEEPVFCSYLGVLVLLFADDREKGERFETGCVACVGRVGVVSSRFLYSKAWTSAPLIVFLGIAGFDAVDIVCALDLELIVEVGE